MNKRFISVLCSALFIIPSFTACKSNKDTQEIKVFTSFFAAQGNPISETNSMQEAIAQKTGAKCIETWLKNQENPSDIISDMIISGEYPDFISADNDGHNKLMEANAYIPIDEYWDDYPNIKNYFSENEWNRIRSDNGHIYYIPQFSNCYMYDTGTIHNDEAFWIQAKVLKWAGYPKINTLDEYFDVLEKYVEANPVDENGQPNIGYEILTDDGYFFCLENAPQFLDGYPNDGSCMVNPDTLEAMNYDTTPTAEKWFRKLNEEYAKGIIDPECFVLDVNQYYDKIKSGNVLGMVDQYWNFNNAAKDLPDECRYIPLGVVIEDGIEEHYHSQIAFNDSVGLGISVSCDDVDGALKFVNDLLDPEIHTMRFWGEEGIDYNVGDDGVFYLTAEQEENRKKETHNTERMCPYTYFPYYSGMNRDGVNAYAPHCQPTEFYNRLGDTIKECFDAYGVKTYVEMLNKAEENPDWYPMWAYTSTFTADTDYGLAKQNMDKIKKQYLPAVVMSDDFDSAWAEYMTAYEENCDVDAYLNELTAEVKRRCENN